MTSCQVVNIVFGDLAKTTLHFALTACGRQEKILAFPDDLSFGPIDPLDGARRQKWISDNFYFPPEKWNIFPDQLGHFFSTVASIDGKLICWVCPNSIYEYCGFSEYLREITATNIYFIDTMDFDVSHFGNIDVPTEGIAIRLAHLSPSIASHLIGKEVLVSPRRRAEWQLTWERIRGENAPLRTIDQDGIKSVSISHFDRFLFARLEPDWRLARQIVTRAAVDANPGRFFRVDTMVLAGRLQALIREGRIEATGNTSDYPTLMVRSSGRQSGVSTSRDPAPR